MSNHTPGPWKAVRGIVKFLDHGRWYTLGTINGPRLSTEGKQANARLIAEAPAMLEALKALTHPDGLSSANIRPNLDSARAVLDRIEGRL